MAPGVPPSLDRKNCGASSPSQRIKIKLKLAVIDNSSIRTEDIHPEKADQFALGLGVNGELFKSHAGRPQTDARDFKRLDFGQRCLSHCSGRVNRADTRRVSQYFNFRSEERIHASQCFPSI